MTSARIVQLYPDELGVAGDRGNVLAIATRLSAAGITPDVVEYRRGDQLAATADLVVIGGGPLSAMRNVYTDLLVNGARLQDLAAGGVPFLAYGSGAELLGRTISLGPQRAAARNEADRDARDAGETAAEALPGQGADRPDLEGLGIFSFRTARTAVRKVGYVLSDSPLGRLVGFEDNASTWLLDDDATALGTIVAGGGNGDGREGVLSGPSIATQIGGPLLPLNPAVTDSFVGHIAARLGVALPASGATTLDEYARRAREVITSNAAHVFSRI